MPHTYNGPYEDQELNHLAYPMGGIGAGMICLEGAGALSHVSLRGQPDVHAEPLMYAALSVQSPQGRVARVLEGPVPRWKVYGPPEAGNGLPGTDYGLPRFDRAAFQDRFPFGKVVLSDGQLPVAVEITGWSPFVPGDPDASSLPVAALEYSLRNTSNQPLEAVFSFHARNFMASPDPAQPIHPESAVLKTNGGFTLWQPGSEAQPWGQGAFSAVVDDPETHVNCAWFRGGWFDAPTMVWKSIEDGAAIDGPPLTEDDPSPGGSLYVPLNLAPDENRTLVLRLAWHVPQTNLRLGNDQEDAPACCTCSGTHTPWYAGFLDDIEAVNRYWRTHYADLRSRTQAFTDCFYDTTLPDEVVEAVAANLTILKSPTAQRQTDGRLWLWEGCCDTRGCCHGSCTHVWNYAQAIPHLFPSLERTLRETEFFVNQDERGHQAFRASLPIRPPAHDFHAAADGQLGGIMKVYREWQISGDELWLRRIWPKVKQSLDYCIETWDPDHRGILVEPHHNTYDIELFGANGMCTSFYLGALQAACQMADALGDDVFLYSELLERGTPYMESELWNGEYFIQQIQWKGLRAADPTESEAWNVSYSPEARELLQEEGPKYQYGNGCLSDGVLGAWIAAMCSVDEFLDANKVRGHLTSVHQYNLKHDLAEAGHTNPQRPTFALGREGGLLLCTWPHGDALSLPFVYSNEVWTGIEYQVAAHLMLIGEVENGLEIVRVLRNRYNGPDRNPFDEYECGHWYGRALASYGLLQGLTGARYDAVEKTLYLEPRIPGDFRAFLATATGYATVGVQDGEPFIEVKQGTLPYERLVYNRKGDV